MKKLILSLIIMAYSALYAQNKISLERYSSEEKSFHLHLNELSTKAVRDFRKAFPLMQNETWAKEVYGYVAEFAVDDIDYLVRYDRKGNWLHTVKTYHEDEIPAAIQRLVGSEYFDYAITLVEEATIREITFYLVHIENESGTKKLNLRDGEITMVEEHEK